jgi:FdhE protein
MVSEYAITEDQVKKAFASVKKKRPAYKSLLTFYRKVFIAQEKSKKKIRLKPVSLSREMVTIKNREGFPLIDPSEFTVDMGAAGSLFAEILKIGKTTKGAWFQFSEAMEEAMGRLEVDPKELFRTFLERDDSYLKKAADDHGVDAEMLGAVVYNSLRPSLELSAKQLSSYLTADTPWERGYCPVCGNLPGLSVFEDEGERFFFCHFCWHKWAARRIYCPYCDNRNVESLHYFFSEEENGYRVDVCDRCRKYIKTVDTRKLTHLFYPPLEQISTLHLDMKAKEMGLESGNPIILNT